MNQITYSVVLLDGKEKQNITFEEVRDLFFRRQINQDSLIASSENPRWQMLKRVFDVTRFAVPDELLTPPSATAAAEQSPPNSFDQPVTFNQFPAQAGNHIQNADDAANGYTQHNQSQTHYQAAAPTLNGSVQNKQAPQWTAGYQTAAGGRFGSAAFGQETGARLGLKQAAVFLIASALVSLALTAIEKSFADQMPTAADRYAPGGGRIAISIIIDLYLAYKLWQNDDYESARKWVLVRAYIGFAVWGVFFPFAGIGELGVFVALLNFFIYFLFLLSIGLVLHGKASPSAARVMIGTGTFAVYFLISIGVAALSSVALLAPNLAVLEISSAQIEKYKIDGREFEDAKTGAKVTMPEGWSLISPSNPVMSSPTARMVGFGKATDSLTMLDIVPVPVEIDIRNANSSELLEVLAKNVSENFADILKEGNPSLREITAREITRMTVSVGRHPAKLLVVESTMNRRKYRSHLVITFDELSLYVLHSWCPVDNYERAKDQFYALEKSFSIPDKINTPFAQAAEREKSAAPSKKVF